MVSRKRQRNLTSSGSNNAEKKSPITLNIFVFEEKLHVKLTSKSVTVNLIDKKDWGGVAVNSPPQKKKNREKRKWLFSYHYRFPDFLSTTRGCQAEPEGQDMAIATYGLCKRSRFVASLREDLLSKQWLHFWPF